MSDMSARSSLLTPIGELKSIESRAIVKEILEKKGTFDEDTIKWIEETELSHVRANGQIPYNQNTLKGMILNKINQEIDGAKLGAYDYKKDSIDININDSSNLDFWCNLEIDMKKLQSWLKIHGIEMTYCRTNNNNKDITDEL